MNKHIKRKFTYSPLRRQTSPWCQNADEQEKQKSKKKKDKKKKKEEHNENTEKNYKTWTKLPSDAPASRLYSLLIVVVVLATPLLFVLADLAITNSVVGRLPWVGVPDLS